MRKHKIGIIALTLIYGLHAESATTFAGFSWDKNNSPDLYASMPQDDLITRLPTSTTQTTHFPSATAVSGDYLTLGELSGLGPRQSALNLPAGNNGTSERSGIELSWSNNRVLPNMEGADFVVYESGTRKSKQDSKPDAFMVQVHSVLTGEWSAWYYSPAQNFELYPFNGPAQHPRSGEGAFATSFDLSDLGISAADSVDAIRIANITLADRMEDKSGIGNVILNDKGDTSLFLPQPGPWASFETYNGEQCDPDPLYVGILHNVNAM